MDRASTSVECLVNTYKLASQLRTAYHGSSRFKEGGEWPGILKLLPHIYFLTALILNIYLHTLLLLRPFEGFLFDPQRTQRIVLSLEAYEV